MSLIHALVARGSTVLAEYATGTAELKPGELSCL
jgi:vesicle-associated membrane protein 7